LGHRGAYAPPARDRTSVKAPPPPPTPRQAQQQRRAFAGGAGGAAPLQQRPAPPPSQGTRADLVRRLLEAKEKSGKSFSQIAKEVRGGGRAQRVVAGR
jgi:hypothetical protein